MSCGYFGAESTCERCDYPRRLHHLRGVLHDYTPGPNENALAEGQVDEGNENCTNPYEEQIL